MGEENINDKIETDRYEGLTIFGSSEITKAEIQMDVSKRFQYMMQRFFSFARRKSKLNDLMINLYFHAIMGAYLKNYTVTKVGGVTDLRVPLVWFQNSRTGKSQLNKVAVDVCNRIGVKVAVETEFTAAGMIGSHDNKKHDFNIKNNLHPGESHEKQGKNGDMKVIKYSDPIIYGDLKNFELVIIDEGKILFNPGKHTENFLSVIQPALDYPGKVRKKLSAEQPVEYDCDCTLITTSVPAESVTTDLLLQGFFPRCLFYSREISVDKMENMLGEMHMSLFDEGDYIQEINDFADAIEKHPLPIDRMRYKITVLPECLDILQAACKRWFDMIRKDTHTSETKVLMSFVSGMDTFLFKIAGQIAVINEQINPEIRNEKVYLVNQENMEYAIDLADLLLNRMKDNLMIDDDKEEEKFFRVAMLIGRDLRTNNTVSVTRDQLINMVMIKYCTGRLKAAKIFDRMKSANLFVEENTSKGIMVKLNSSLWTEDPRKPRRK